MFIIFCFLNNALNSLVNIINQNSANYVSGWEIINAFCVSPTLVTFHGVITIFTVCVKCFMREWLFTNAYSSIFFVKY